MTLPVATKTGPAHLVSSLRWPLATTVVALISSYVLGGLEALLLVGILTVLEVSLSFDNAVVNAKVLERMNPFWQQAFLTVGIIIAVFGMRLLFPLLIVGVSASLNPGEALRLALEGGSVETPGTYAYILNEAHPAIGAFGGMFLGMLFLDFVFEDREVSWLTPIERPLARIGKLNQVSVVVALVVLVIVAQTLSEEPSTVLVSGILGIVTYLLVGGLGDLFEEIGQAEHGESGPNSAQLAAGKAGFFLFLYLEVLDASFSFDGVIGAFAITQNIFIIAVGLGVGAVYIRSLTVYLVKRGTLNEYIYLEHGAMWAIGVLAAILLLSVHYEIPEVFTGLVGVAFIAAAFATSIMRNRRVGNAPAIE